MKKTILLPVFIITFIFQAFPQFSKITDDSSGVEIIFTAGNSIFPQSWYGGQIKGVAESLDTSEIKRSVEIVKKALAKYPSGVLKKNLKKVYVLKKLSFYGVDYGGTNTKDVVYLANKGLSQNYTDEFIERAFHAEFSSVLMANYPKALDQKKWAAINGKDFQYGAVNGYEAIKAGKSSEDYEKKILEFGFLNEYAMSTLENDFNSFAKNLFYAEGDFWKIAEANSRLTMKLQLILDFYKTVDIKLTKEYFKKLAEL
ncbi:MAG: hypothetical protein V1904_06780 [Bacteroidota bacterium]